MTIKVWYRNDDPQKVISFGKSSGGADESCLECQIPADFIPDHDFYLIVDGILVRKSQEEITMITMERQAAAARRILVAAAQASYDTTKDVAVLCYLKGIALPAAWSPYCDELLAIISGTSEATELPSQPDRPEGL